LLSEKEDISTKENATDLTSVVEESQFCPGNNVAAV
jgi:hypothetical protein